MSKKLTPEIAGRFLSDTKPETSFFVHGGPIIKNVEELYAALQAMSEEQFIFHRNNGKNDFYNWMLNIVGDIKLANDIARAKTKDTTLKKVSERVNYLKSIKEGKNA
jgi:hypothetical protein